jgi:putative SOS response-associated peptidase YedK
VILDRAEERTWLDPATSPEHAQALLHPLAARETRARAVSKAVNDARCDGPECLADPLPEPVQDSLFGDELS